MKTKTIRVLLVVVVGHLSMAARCVPVPPDGDRLTGVYQD